MRYIVNEQVILSKSPEGPLVSYIGPFAYFLNAQGYSVSSIRIQVRLAAAFSRWVKQKGIGVRSINSDHIKCYLRYRYRHVKPTSSDTASLRHLINFLRTEGVLRSQKILKPRLSPVERCTQSFERYLREDRALAEATIINYIPFIRCFLTKRFGRNTLKFSSLCAHDVIKFIQIQAPRLHQKRAKLMTSALRSFLNYLLYRGDIKLDLAAAVPIVPNWSMPSIPRGISPEQTRQLLASIDQSTATGRRDYAILLLLARLGLRSSEIVCLELDDIDWSAGILYVCGKGGRRNEFPLSQELGQAITAYLRSGRPISTCRRVFLRAKAPIRGFLGSSSVGSIVYHSLKRAGIKAPTFGAHQFRHGLATEMLQQGASLNEIGDVLGHRHPQTPKIYAKVDIEALRTLAQPWPGGVS